MKERGKLRHNHANTSTEPPTISRQEASISNREITQKTRCIKIYTYTLKSDIKQYTTHSWGYKIIQGRVTTDNETSLCKTNTIKNPI